MQIVLDDYKVLFNIDKKLKLSKIDHDNAIVADVYRVYDSGNPCFILKICSRPNDYKSEIYFLNHFKKQIKVPLIIKAIPPSRNNYGAILIEYLSGCLLNPELITKEIAFELGSSLATIHSNKTDGFGYLNRDKELASEPTFHFKEKFQEGIEECRDHLPADLITKSCNYFEKEISLIENVDGPCIIHRDFRPGNIIVNNNAVSGIIDWSSARSSFAEDDFCSIENNEWANFNNYKEDFFEGYSSIRKIPEYHQLMPLLRFNRAIASIGFTVKRNTWNTTDSRFYQSNRAFIDNFF